MFNQAHQEAEKEQDYENKMFVALILVTLIMLAKFMVAFLTKSLALFSDSLHLVTDFVSLIISWLALRTAKKPADYQHTFGYHRYGILSALLNNITLIAISVFIFYQAIQRYLHPTKVEPLGMIVIAVFGLLINLFIVYQLQEDTGNLNIKSSFLHFAGDALADLGVLIGGIVIYFTGWLGIDTLLSAILACLILKSALVMSKECLAILLERTPPGVDIAELCTRLCQIPGIAQVNDIHVWSLTKEKHSMTAHLMVDEMYIFSEKKIIEEVQLLLKEEFCITHSTVQLEKEPCSNCCLCRMKDQKKTYGRYFR